MFGDRDWVISLIVNSGGGSSGGGGVAAAGPRRVVHSDRRRAGSEGPGGCGVRDGGEPVGGAVLEAAARGVDGFRCGHARGLVGSVT